MYKITGNFNNRIGRVIEFSMDYLDFSYLVVYGKHINGYFCAVPGWGWGAEMSGPDSLLYNRDQLAEAKIPMDIAVAISRAIQEVWHED